MQDAQEDVCRIVPWFSSSEWIDTANQVYTGNSTLQAQALDVLRLWRARCDALPTGVDATLVLLSALESSHQDSLDNLSQRLALSAAITRFLNHALTAGQKDPFNQSMFKKANDAGLPGWIVQLRHEIAHGRFIPALEPLLDAAHTAVEWLGNNYWQQPPFDWKPPKPELDPLIDEWEALCACLQVGYKYVASLPDQNLKSSNSKFKTVSEAIKNVEAKILSTTAGDHDSLISAILLSQTFLAPPSGLYGRDEFSSALVAQWRPLLVALHSGRQIPALITKLHSQGSRLASLWIMYLLEVVQKLKTCQERLCAAGVVIKEKSSTSKFAQKNIQVHDIALESKIREDIGLESDWPLFVAAPNKEEFSRLAIDIASTPHKNGQLYLNKILELADTDKAQIKKINQLWTIFFGDNPTQLDGDIKSLEDLTQEKCPIEGSDKWMKCYDWHAKALGILPWQEGHVGLDMDFEWE